MNTITRIFTVKRGDYEIPYPFTTYPDIFFPEKVEGNLRKLFEYLLCAFTLQDEDIIMGGKKSISQMPELLIDTKHSDNNEIIDLCQLSEYHGEGRKQHDTVQKYFLENDEKTIATEIPVWMDEMI